MIAGRTTKEEWFNYTADDWPIDPELPVFTKLIRGEEADYTNWMSELPKDTPLWMMTIPGVAGNLPSLKEHLHAGIRCVTIDESADKLDITLLKQFVEDHPSESLFLYTKDNSAALEKGLNKAHPLTQYGEICGKIVSIDVDSAVVTNDITQAGQQSHDEELKSERKILITKLEEHHLHHIKKNPTTKPNKSFGVTLVDDFPNTVPALIKTNIWCFIHSDKRLIEPMHFNEHLISRIMSEGKSPQKLALSIEHMQICVVLRSLDEHALSSLLNRLHRQLVIRLKEKMAIVEAGTLGASVDILIPYIVNKSYLCIDTFLKILQNKKDTFALACHIDYIINYCIKELEVHTPVSVYSVELAISTGQLREPIQKAHEKGIKKNWDVEEKYNLVKTCVSRFFLGGKSCYGKTSLARSLLHNKGITTKEDERTEVLEFSPWRIDDDTSVTVYDLGGHQCYQNLSHIFHCDAKNNYTLLPHQIDDKDYSTTCSWINDVISRSPLSAIHFILTKSDLVPKEQHNQAKEGFKTNIMQFLECKMEQIDSKLMEEELKSEKILKKATITKLQQIKEKYKSLVEDLDQEKILDVVSCRTEEGLSEFRSKIVQMVQKQDFKIEIPKTAHHLYQRLGKLGLEGSKQRKAATSEKNLMSEENQNESNEKQSGTESRDVNPKRNKSFSSDTKDETPIQKHIIPNQKDEIPIRKDQIPLQKKETSKKKLMKQEPLQYVSFENAKLELKNLLPTSKSDDEIEEELVHYLTLLNCHCLLLWYNTTELKELIFNDLYSLVQMLKTLFQHSFQENYTAETTEKPECSFDFRRLSEEQHVQVFIRKEKITETKHNNLLNNLKDAGVFSNLLLKILVQKFHFQDHIGELIHMLDHLGIAYSIPSEEDENDIENRDLFFPWYVCQSVTKEDNVRKMKENSNLPFLLKVTVGGTFPSAFFNCFAVRIYKHLAPKGPKQTIVMWQDQIFAYINKNQVYLEYIKSTTNDDKIDIHVASPTQVTPIRESWNFIDNCLKVIDNLNDEWWECLSNDMYLQCQCRHCNGALEPHQWDIVDHLKEKCSGKLYQCPEDLTEDIPVAFLFPLPEDKDEAQTFVSEAEQYLKNHGQTTYLQSSNPEITRKLPAEITSKSSEDITSKSPKEITIMSTETSRINELDIKPLTPGKTDIPQTHKSEVKMVPLTESKPKITFKHRERFAENSKFSFECWFNPVEKTINWYRNGKKLKQNSTFDLLFQDTYSKLTVSGVQTTEEETYVCIVENSLGEDTAEFVVKPTDEAKPVITSKWDKCTFSTHEKAILRCEFDSKGQNYDIKWFKYNDLLITSDKYHIEVREPTTKLTVNDTREEDSGCYKCVITTTCGRAHIEIKCTVKFDKSATSKVTRQAETTVPDQDDHPPKKRRKISNETTEEDRQRRRKAYKFLSKQVKGNKDISPKVCNIHNDELEDTIYISISEEKYRSQVKEYIKNILKYEMEVENNVTLLWENLEFTLHEKTFLEYLGQNILPCVGPGSRFRIDPNLRIMNAIKRGQGINRLLDKFGTIGCFAKKDGQMYFLSVKHVVMYNPYRFDTNIETGQKETICGIKGIIKSTHPAQAGTVPAHLEDCVVLSKHYKGYHGVYQNKFIDIALYGPLSREILSCHKTKLKKKRVRVYRGDYEDLNQKLVQKRGSKTGYTEGKILTVDYQHSRSINSFLVTSYNSDEIPKLRGKFANKGDSGALVILKPDNPGDRLQAVGLVQSRIGAVLVGGTTYENVTLCVYLKDCLDAIDEENLKLHYSYLKPRLKLRKKENE